MIEQHLGLEIELDHLRALVLEQLPSPQTVAGWVLPSITSARWSVRAIGSSSTLAGLPACDDGGEAPLIIDDEDTGERLSIFAVPT